MNGLKTLAISTLMLSALSACGGGGAKVSTQNTTTTVGQELQDLDRAYQQGLMSEKEYNKQRDKVMER